jgi:hypothetical protein
MVLQACRVSRSARLGIHFPPLRYTHEHGCTLAAESHFRPAPVGKTDPAFCSQVLSVAYARWQARCLVIPCHRRCTQSAGFFLCFALCRWAPGSRSPISGVYSGYVCTWHVHLSVRRFLPSRLRPRGVFSNRRQWKRRAPERIESCAIEGESVRRGVSASLRIPPALNDRPSSRSVREQA